MKSRIAYKAILAMFSLFTIGIISAYAQTEEWRVTHDFSTGAPPNLFAARDIGQQIGFDAVGNVYVAVTSNQWLTRTSDNPVDVVVFKYDTDGNEQWYVGGFQGSFVDFHVDPQGNVYGIFSAYSPHPADDPTEQNAHIFKISSDGFLAWWDSWNNSFANESDWPVALDVDTNGNVYFLIKSDFNPGPSGNYAAVILKYDAAGNVLWEQTGSTAYPNPTDMDLDDAGNPYVLEDGRMSKYSSADGALLCSGNVEYWWDDDGLPDNPTFWAEAEAVDIEVGPDGNVYIAAAAEQRHWFWTGTDWDSENLNNFFSTQYGGACDLLWSDEFGTYEDEDRPRELVFDNNGDMLVSGPSASQLATLRYSPDGIRQATYRYSEDDAGAFHVDGQYAYVIESPTLALHKYLLSTGAEQWNVPLDFPFLTANDVIVEPTGSGNFYLTGSVDDIWSHQPNTVWYANDMVLVKYSQAEPVDGDLDGVPDAEDNCLVTSNAAQLDTDGDGYGNLCDGDLNNDGSTNTLDLNLYKLAHRTSVGDANYNPDADFNGDEVINTLDLNIYKGLHRQPPGPSCCGLF